MQSLYSIGWLYLDLSPIEVCSPLEWRGKMIVGPGRVLLCFPDDYEAFLSAWNVVADCGLDRSRLIIVARRPYLHVMGKKETEKRIAYEPSEVNRFGLAKRSLVRRVRRTRPTIAVDLYTDGAPIGAHLCLRSGAQIRAGLREEGRGRIFNFLLRGSSIGSYEDRIHALFTYLGLLPAHRDRETVGLSVDASH